MKRQIIIGHVFTLLLGGLIYILFRQDTLKMFSWFDNINLSTAISELRLLTAPFSGHFPNWFLYSLPDGLWLFSYLSVLLAVWDNVISKHNIYWILFMPLIAIFSEVGQFIKMVPGTFDFIDLIFYALGSSLPILIFANSKSKISN